MVWGPNVESAKLLFHVNNFATFLSFLGSYFMIYFCRKVPEPRSLSLKLVLAIAVADFVYSIANLMSALQDIGPEVSNFCYLEAAIRAISFVLSVYFSICISILCYKTSKSMTSFDEDAWYRKILIIAVVISVFLIFLPAYVEDIYYTNGDVFCFITYKQGVDKERKLFIRMIYEGLPIFLGLFISIFAYVLTIRRIRALPTIVLAGIDINLNKLFWYPAVMFITVVPSVVDNFGAIIFDAKVPVALKVIHLLMTHGIGFSNALVYGIQRKLYHIHHSKPRRSELSKFRPSFDDDSYSSITEELARAL